MSFSVQRSRGTDAAAVAAMACKIWHSSPLDELIEAFRILANDPDAAVFQVISEGIPRGFAQCSLRNDYVEGTSSSPVGYLEGIYVEPEYRNRGCARALLNACQDWARKKGCSEFASDCELTNTDSLRFHLNSGFREAGRIICFTKTL